MPATLHIYIPQISIKYHLSATFIYHTIAKYVPAINMPLKCHMPKLLDVQRWRYKNICATYELNANVGC